jgi:hypothetical protein
MTTTTPAPQGPSDFRKRGTRALIKRHEDRIRVDAERIAQQIGYALARIESGKTASIGHHIDGIIRDAQEIAGRIAALEAIGELNGIIEASED